MRLLLMGLSLPALLLIISVVPAACGIVFIRSRSHVPTALIAFAVGLAVAAMISMIGPTTISTP